MTDCKGASAPPTSIASALPSKICSAANPMATADEAHVAEMAAPGPLSLKACASAPLSAANVLLAETDGGYLWPPAAGDSLRLLNGPRDEPTMTPIRSGG